MLVRAFYEDGKVYLLYDNGEYREEPYKPSLLIPRGFLEGARCTSHGCFVEGEMEELLDLYEELSQITDAIIFPEPERQYMLRRGLRPFTAGFEPSISSTEEALYYLTLSFSQDPGRAYLENVLFLRGIARSLRLERRQNDIDAVIVALDLNPDDTVIGSSGDILLPSSIAEVPSPITIRTLDGYFRTVYDGAVYLAEALLNGLPYKITKPIYSSIKPSPVISSLIKLLKLLRASVRDYREASYYLSSASFEILLSSSSYLLYSDVLGRKGRTALHLGYGLLKGDENLYNNFLSLTSTCCPDSSARGSYLRALYSLLTEHLR